jgi:glycosyltransferase involved in cell wall biosynthesis
MPTVSVIIKTYNEEENISKAIESSLRATAPHGGEVIVADSGSTDLTTEVASRYPVKIIQLTNVGERCCGIAPQLGFQYSSGDFIYLLDGDMELDSDFILLGLEALNANPRLAGVGGFVREMRLSNSEFVTRQKRQLIRKASDRANIDCLNGGGLYRRAAIADVGYFSDRNLHSFEEFELGARLRSKGWTLMFLDRLSVKHYGYKLGTYQLLWRRIASKYVYGSGEVLRAAIDGKFAAEALLTLPVFRPAIGVWLYWMIVLFAIVGADSMPTQIAIFVLAAAAPIVAMTLRNAGSFALGAYSVAAWHAVAFGFLMGLFRRRLDPSAPIDARLISPTTI